VPVGLLLGKCFAVGCPITRECSLFHEQGVSTEPLDSSKKGQPGVTVSWYYRPEQLSLLLLWSTFSG
jgi:hypothetical protein